jgi:hypothetical protein
MVNTHNPFAVAVQKSVHQGRQLPCLARELQAPTREVHRFSDDAQALIRHLIDTGEIRYAFSAGRLIISYHEIQHYLPYGTDVSDWS